MEDRLREQDEKIALGSRIINDLTQTVSELKERLQSHECHDNVAVTTATLPPPSTPARPASNVVPPEVDEGFTLVRRGGKTVRPIIQPTVCSNRFKILEEEDEPASSFLVGDSMIRQQLTEFCG